MTLDPASLTDFLARTGIVGLLVFILVSGQRGLWVWGYTYTEMRAERDRYRAIAERLLGQADRSADVVDRAVSVVEKRKGDS